MNIASYIFSGLFAISIICSFVIPVKLVKRIANSLIFPLMTGCTISMLTNWLPDSFHNIIITALSFGLLSISVALSNFREYKKSFDVISTILLILSFIPISNFLGSVFYLNHIQHFVIILAIIVYIAIAIFMATVLKKQTPVIYIKILITYFAAALLNLFTFLDLIYEQRLYAPFLFAGSVIVLLIYVFTTLDTKVFKTKTGAYISKIGQIAGYSLISTGLFFMIAM